jgi:DNA polymerase-4
MPAFCRDCLVDAEETDRRCPRCRSPRLVAHPKLNALAIAHVDCDAFYATIEKRDDPRLATQPVIVGGGQRGVVAACCYVARTFGIRSAMPMFEARRLCPHAVVIKPNMAKYVEVGRAVRARMQDLTPLVEPLSIDEAFLDLTGTERLHGLPPARTLARFALAVEREIGITVSVGLSGNKFLAKIASDLDKPRGFALLDPDAAPAFLAPKPVSFIFGVGAASQKRLAEKGFRTIADLQRADRMQLIKLLGEDGLRLSELAFGRDRRVVNPDRDMKTVSAETTFHRDIGAPSALERQLWRLCERVSERLKAKEIAGSTVTLKLKTADFRIRTRARSLPAPTQLAERIYAAGRDLLRAEADGTAFRLIGIGVSALRPAREADPADLIDERKADAERAMDKVRRRFGRDVLVKGLSLDSDSEDD